MAYADFVSQLGLGNETIRMCSIYNWWVGSRNVVLNDAGFSIPNGVLLANFPVFVVIELLVSLISQFSACSVRISGDTQTKYCKPSCTCTLKVNNIIKAYTSGNIKTREN